jgi:glyoxylase-like metal-dependent hydrolase (beta-lactamase superfamily II)
MQLKSRTLRFSLALFVLCAASRAQAPQPDGGGVRAGALPKSWRTGGPACGSQQEWEVHEYNPDLIILRENGCVNYEKPFLYLYFGSERALLIDTGAGETHVATAVSKVVDHWARTNHKPAPPLIVGHSHSHDDHTGGDAQMRMRANTTVIPLTVEATMKTFGIPHWPDGAGTIDLGGRIIDVLPIPGHDVLSLAYYDRQTGLLHMGDSLYPGRLYVHDFPAFVASTQRMVDFTRGKIVTNIVGCHIEQARTPYLDYKIGSKYQPDEHSLEMGRGELLELNEALSQMKTPVRMAFRDFTIWPN